ncbi:hypothetical protein WR25_09484 [Diploscapter pachys]|uniref:Uncharacterized protein n=1 Tax=Diploscapter pachys TaxID=2018661 RepID=A0A2A2LN23_9BILA|nr:hypothetical protein WR25_09484 [Diploscapter pachys]
MKLWLVLHLLVQSSFCKIDHEEVHVGEKKDVRKQEHEQLEAHKVDPKQTQIDHAKIYTGLFKASRRQHQIAVNSAKGIDIDKRRGFLEEIIVNIRNILTETRSVIERIGHPASAPFPHDSETLKDAISKVLENTALFSDLSLHFPKVFLKKMEKDRKLKTVIIWAYEYSKDTGTVNDR